MKSRAPAKPYSGPERVLYVTETSHRPTKSRKSGRSVLQPGPGGLLVVGMGESLAKTFTSHEAVAAYAEKNGYKVKVTKPLRRTSAHNRHAAAAAVAAALILASEP